MQQNIEGPLNMSSAAQAIVEEEFGARLKALAVIRATLVIPLALLIYLAIRQWGNRSESIPAGVLIALAAVSLAYIFAGLFFAARMRPFSATQLAVCTAILDPFIVSAWLACMGEPGFVFVCLYLFAILAFGARLGVRPMLISQVASLTGYGGVLALNPAWGHHSALALANLLLLAIVPVYFRALLRKLADVRVHAAPQGQTGSAPANEAENARSIAPIPIVPVVYGKRVLVAGCNGADLIEVRDLLERDRHAVTVSKTGQQAIEIMTSLPFDIIFMEPIVGDLDGASILQLYRFDKANPAPVFFITDDTDKEAIGKLLDSGAAAVLQKPITSVVLRHAISQAFQDEAMANQSEPAPIITLKPESLRYIDERAIQDLQDICAGPEFLTEILSTAIIDIEANCKKILTALDQDDFGKVRPSAHALRGVCASVGATQLAAIATQLMRITAEDLSQSRDRWRRDVSQFEMLSVNALGDILLTTDA
jgi:CheY-like chemotaxis protein/HPt (histidine-containing phosphotransfer) domain-containing protein